MIEFTDSVALGDARVTSDGYLVASARIARTGVQTYAGREIGKPDMPVVRVYRPKDEVFADGAMQSLAHRPVTVEHPAKPVTADNWRSLAVGYTGDEVRKDEDGTVAYVRVPLTVMDAAAIAAVKGGKRQLSVGYTCDVDWTPGVTPDGEPYDAIQRNIRGNHLAIVDAARAGPACRIGDQRPEPGKGDVPVTDKSQKTITVDGIPVEVSDAAAAVIAKLQSQIADADKARGEQSAKIEAKDGEIAALKAKLADVELTPAKLDAAVAERSAVIDAAKKIVPTLDAKGKTLPAIRREAVAAKLADAKDMSDAGIEGAFAVLASGAAKSDPIRDAMNGATVVNIGDVAAKREQAFADHMKELTTAWNAPAKKEA